MTKELSALKLLSALNGALDAKKIQEITRLIVFGKEKKSFFPKKSQYQESGIFNTYDNNNNNIFHLLAKKGILSLVLPEVFKHKTTICKRENIDEYRLGALINSENQEGFRPAHITVARNDFEAFQLLHQYGASLAEDGRQDSVVKYIVKEQPTFLRNIIAHSISIMEFICFKIIAEQPIFPQIQGDQKNNFAPILNQIQIAKNAPMDEFFLDLFKHAWKNILANTDEQSKMEKILDVVEKHNDLKLSNEDLTSMVHLDNPSTDDAKLISQVRNFILSKCATEILKDPLFEICFEKFAEGDFKNNLKFPHINNFIAGNITREEAIQAIQEELAQAQQVLLQDQIQENTQSAQKSQQLSAQKSDFDVELFSENKGFGYCVDVLGGTTDFLHQINTDVDDNNSAINS
jgi:hypothetical protein